ncbi:hypothetical protein J3Q64DRAFT_1335537 [Phycomyces blakesleeanus]|uniref:Uncharacterized protein n=1 Tax=Phycomyces blakesleeanus TaxID=4837 RepID=A0ABR3B7G0_PHYBL
MSPLTKKCRPPKLRVQAVQAVLPDLATRYSYFSWLPTAGRLSPAYDYFDFANTFDENQRCINRWYGNAIKKSFGSCKGSR